MGNGMDTGYQVATLALRAYKVIFYKNYTSGPTIVWKDNDLMVALKEDTKVQQNPGTDIG